MCSGLPVRDSRRCFHAQSRTRMHWLPASGRDTDLSPTSRAMMHFPKMFQEWPGMWLDKVHAASWMASHCTSQKINNSNSWISMKTLPKGAQRQPFVPFIKEKRWGVTNGLLDGFLCRAEVILEGYHIHSQFNREEMDSKLKDKEHFRRDEVMSKEDNLN